jgi:hypothetical protein
MSLGTAAWLSAAVIAFYMLAVAGGFLIGVRII